MKIRINTFRMISACIIMQWMIPLVVYANGHTFSDVPSDAYYSDAVEWAVQNEITAGLSPDIFGSEKVCTRAQVVSFLWRANGYPVSGITEVSFKDVNTNDYYYDAMLWAVENEIVNGYNEWQFAPNDPITRGQFVTMLYKEEGSPEIQISNTFTDVPETAYYRNAVLWALENGVTQGISFDRFDPDSGCVRSQIVTFLWRNLVKHEVYASDYGLSPENSGEENSKILQSLVDMVSRPGGTIYISSGEYEFASNGSQRIGNHCIKMKSNVNIIGNGENTVLKPTGSTESGLDMFYYNDHADYASTIFLANCRFEDFMIDASDTSCEKYTSAGKGFMFNLFRNCHWKNVTVKNTDATGFGIDCPIDSSITNCIAESCGKAATIENVGASGFGIGFGYTNNESISISNCESYGNKKYGFFVEHQRRFDSKHYTADSTNGFYILDCIASGNYSNFGGVQAMDTIYENCTSKESIHHGFSFENSVNCKAVDCYSENEKETSFVILQSSLDGGMQEVKNITYENCTSVNAQYGAKIVTYGSSKEMSNNAILNCAFYGCQENTIYTSGNMKGLSLIGNSSDTNNNSFRAVIEEFVNMDNSWNE